MREVTPGHRTPGGSAGASAAPRNLDGDMALAAGGLAVPLAGEDMENDDEFGGHNGHDDNRDPPDPPINGS